MARMCSRQGCTNLCLEDCFDRLIAKSLLGLGPVWSVQGLLVRLKILLYRRNRLWRLSATFFSVHLLQLMAHAVQHSQHALLTAKIQDEVHRSCHRLSFLPVSRLFRATLVQRVTANWCVTTFCVLSVPHALSQFLTRQCQHWVSRRRRPYSTNG